MRWGRCWCCWSIRHPVHFFSVLPYSRRRGYRTRIHDWDKAARHTISAFRSYYAASNRAQAFEDVIDDLLSRSAEFSTMWNSHEVKKVGAGNKTIIDIHGQINSFTYTSLEVESAPGMYLIFYMAHGAKNR
ncbi:hypothetical protein [Cronobacter sakazakii]|uniref:MmyB family transcriptional regulator n=1 Tax=Cronobacter sakazakii TaxID=28141 RepID=UPI003D16A0EC